jgi:hypothetical protein
MHARILAVLVLTACAHDAAPATSTATSEATKPAPSGPMTPPARPSVAPELAVPDTAKLVLVADAKGDQIYECVAGDGGALAWKLHAPSAMLFDASGKQIGAHFGGVDKNLPAGPYWQVDASRVHGDKPVSVANPGSIPLLKLEGHDATAAISNQPGVLSSVAFIQRLETTGGVAPAGACTAGDQVKVPYTARYYFYSAQ